MLDVTTRPLISCSLNLRRTDYSLALQIQAFDYNQQILS